MTEILTCVLCGRRGTQRFVMCAADPAQPEAGHRARCQDRRACQRRIDAATAATDGNADGASAEVSGSGESVAGLAREVEQLRHGLTDAAGLRAQIDDITRVVGDLAAEVEALATRPSRPSAPSWMVAAPAEVPTLLADLIGWLDTVGLYYTDLAAALPVCWLWHPDVVEELLWLRYAWHTAYQGQSASLMAAADWHDRYRPGVVRRVREHTRACSLENHTPPAPPATTPLADQLADLTAWWANRRDQAAPEPTEAQYAAAHARRPGRTRR